jgi:alkylation response protein AidB-like acyl-CoA dehydrogenase
MDLALTEEQRLLRDSVTRFVTDTFSVEERRRVAASTQDESAGLWQRYADLGWLALPIAEGHGGLGGSARDVAILMEAFGHGLALSPYLSTVLLGAGLVAAAGRAAQQAALLPRIASGKLRLAFAYAERGSRFDLGAVQTRAEKSGEGWVLNGRKIAVLDGPSAQQWIVTARTDHGIGLFLVPAGTPGAEMREHARLGGGRAGDLTLTNVTLPSDARLGDAADALPAIEAVVDRALAALCAESVGMMDYLLRATVEYTKMREQFGRPLSANQVVRHRLADMAMACEEARAVTLIATLKADTEPRERGRAASGAKAKVGSTARFVAEQAVQLHGAMGVTDELDIGLYLRRVLMFETLFGGTAHHYRRRLALTDAPVRAA